MRAIRRLLQPARSWIPALVLCAGCGVLMAASGTTAAPATETLPTSGPGSLSVGSASITYLARAGDTLISVARQFTEKSSNWVAIGKLNHIDRDVAIPIGTPIVIPAELLADMPSKATVVAMTGTIAAHAADGTETRLAIGATVLEGMQIETGANSFLTLSLSDRSRISVPSNSRVRIAMLRSARYVNSPRTQVQLIRGQVESRVTPLGPNRGRYEILTPLSVAGVRGTHFRVGFVDGSADQVATETLEGKVGLAHANPQRAAAGTDSLLLPEGKGAITSRLEVGPAIDLLPAPHLATGTAAEFPSNRIALLPVAGARGYHLQIATDNEAVNLIAESRSASTILAVNGLPDGTYYARVSAIDRFGLEGRPSLSPITLRARSETGSAATLRLGPPLVTGSDERSVTLRWQTQPGQSMRLQVARDSGFTYLMGARITTTGQAQLARPSFGTYYARVQLLDTDGNVRASSAAQPFIVTDNWIINDGGPAAEKQSQSSPGR